MTMASRETARSFAFTFWVLVFVAVSLIWPEAFGTWFGFDLKGLIVPLIQVIMFGMGTTLSLGDFARVFRMPWPVLLGMTLQFAVMPFGGFLIARGFGFEPEVATGIILVGSVSGGVASNVMTYIARGDVALSVTMTASSTILSPLATPRLMDLLAGRYMPIPVEAMTYDIINMILVPIAAGLLAHEILYGESPRLERAAFLVALGILAALLAAAAAALRLPFDVPRGLRTGVSIGCGLIALVTAAKWVGHVALGKRAGWVDRALPLASMCCICLIIGIITARSREELLTVGPLLVLAAAAHNGLGYSLGYWGARLLGLPERIARTVSIEVGMQNAGMASALALNTLGSASAALAPAIFGPWMNVSGSVLANFWRRKGDSHGST
jgi:BASS family bile acid:Na+ symporter